MDEAFLDVGALLNRSMAARPITGRSIVASASSNHHLSRGVQARFDLEILIFPQFPNAHPVDHRNEQQQRMVALARRLVLLLAPLAAAQAFLIPSSSSRPAAGSLLTGECVGRPTGLGWGEPRADQRIVSPTSTMRRPFTTTARSSITGRQAAAALPGSKRQGRLSMVLGGGEQLMEPTTAAASVAFLSTLLNVAEEVRQRQSAV